MTISRAILAFVSAIVMDECAMLVLLFRLERTPLQHCSGRPVWLAAAIAGSGWLLMAFGLGFAALWAVLGLGEFSLALSGQSAIFFTMVLSQRSR